MKKKVSSRKEVIGLGSPPVYPFRDEVKRKKAKSKRANRNKEVIGLRSI